MPRLQRAFCLSHERQTPSTEKISHCLSSLYKSLESQAAAHWQHRSLSLRQHVNLEGGKGEEGRKEEKGLRSWDKALGQRVMAGQSHFSFAKHGFREAGDALPRQEPAHLDEPGVSTQHRPAMGPHCRHCCSRGHSNPAAMRASSQLLVLSPVLAEGSPQRVKGKLYALLCEVKGGVLFPASSRAVKQV